jgi:hypothetical protein
MRKRCLSNIVVPIRNVEYEQAIAAAPWLSSQSDTLSVRIERSLATTLKMNQRRPESHVSVQ